MKKKKNVLLCLEGTCQQNNDYNYNNYDNNNLKHFNYFIYFTFTNSSKKCNRIPFEFSTPQYNDSRWKSLLEICGNGLTNRELVVIAVISHCIGAGLKFGHSESTLNCRSKSN